MFFVTGLGNLAWQSDVAGWQWLAISLVAIMVAIGLYERKARPEFLIWRYITLSFLAAIFLLNTGGIASPYMVWLYLLAAIYGYCFRERQVALLCVVVATAFSAADGLVNGLTPYSFHPVAIGFIVIGASKLRSKAIDRINRAEDMFAVLTLRGAEPSSAEVLRRWRQELVDYLGERSIILTTADRQLALLIPNQSISESEYLADTLRRRFSVLNHAPMTIDVGAIQCRPRDRES